MKQDSVEEVIKTV